jgi:cell division septation protein DedD
MLASITAALLVLTSASVWEGAASIAPLGDLPDDGFYAATNSFPRNTVVDITNLETGQSIRVIVAAGLETPGLLAILSRDAAGMIGIRSRSIGRIRMTQPSDPVAFSRFTEGLGSSGDPDYDPRALVSADPLARDYPPSPAEAPAPATGPGDPVSPPAEDPYKPWYDEIVDIDSFSPSASPGADEGIVREPAPAPIYVWEDEPPAETAEAEPPEAETDPWGRPYGDEAAETSAPPRWEAEPDLSIAEEPDAPPAEEAAEPEPETEIARPEPEAGRSGDYEFSLVPAEERPPEDAPLYEIPPELVIDPLPEGGAPEQAAAEPEPVMDESFFVDPLGRISAPPESPPVPVIPAPPPAFVPPLPGIFSVPTIYGLERGKYYLQIGSFSRAESAESLINRVGNGYPLAVQNGGSEDKPLYRVLIGPVNIGESGALLRRFKSIGYSDAFVRSGG